ncbi:MAG: 5-oxoprolinase subunit PxpB [Bacteroidota bacterium]
MQAKRNYTGLTARPTLRSFGPHCILMEWPAVIDPSQQHEILRAASFIMDHYPKRVQEVQPTYHSLAIYLRTGCDVPGLVRNINEEMPNWIKSDSRSGHLVTLPVCYAEEFGWDLRELAASKGISIEEVVRRHTAPEYNVHFLGFLPGFPYLGGLDPSLATNRRSSPRPRIAKGSVGIGGSQTGVYPSESPGGWHIIGRTPLELFDPHRDPSTMINAGDRLKFEPISQSEFDLIEIEIKAGTYQWKRELL